MSKSVVDVEIRATPAEMYPDLYGKRASSNPKKKEQWKFTESDTLRPFDGVEGFLIRTALVRAEGYEKASSRRPKITCSADVVSMCKHLQSADQEHIVLFCLDSQNQLMAIHQASLGSSTGAAIDRQTPLRVALLVGCASLALVHNHPSGNLEPSKQDLDLTKKLIASLNCIGVTMLDHIIVGGGAWLSMLDRGLMEMMEEGRI